MKVLLYLALGVACLLHAAHMAPIVESVKRRLAFLGFVLAIIGYFGLALTEVGTSGYAVANRERSRGATVLQARDPDVPNPPAPSPRAIVGAPRRAHRSASFSLV